MRLSEHQTNDLIHRLEERKYGHQLNSMQLAQKANVSLDEVNRIENQLQLEGNAGWKLSRIADALGITPDLLEKVAGYSEIESEQLNTLDDCVGQSPPGHDVAPRCSDVGLRKIYE